MLLFFVPKTRVYMESVPCLRHVHLGHERDRLAVLGSDILDTGLEDGMTIRHHHGVCETQVYLVLSLGGFTF